MCLLISSVHLIVSINLEGFRCFERFSQQTPLKVVLFPVWQTLSKWNKLFHAVLQMRNLQEILLCHGQKFLGYQNCLAGIYLIIIHHHHPRAHHCRCHLDRSRSLFFFVPDWLDQEMLVKSNKSFLPEELLLSPGCAAFLYEATRRPRTFFASTFQHTPTYLRKNEKIIGSKGFSVKKFYCLISYFGYKCGA